MKLNQFRFLYAIDRYGSISQAARELYTSQPAVSMAIRELEEELGVRILTRDQQGARFTEDGLKVLESAKTIIGETDKLSHLLQEKENNLLRGNCSIGGTSYFTDPLLLKIIVDMRAAYPDLHIRMEDGDSQSIIKRVYDGAIDIGVIMHSNLDQAKSDEMLKKYRLKSYLLFEDEMCFVIGAHHPLAGRESATMSEVLQYPIIQFRSSNSKNVLELFQKIRANLDVLYIEDFSSLWRLPLIGDFAFLSPVSAVENRKIAGLNVLHISDLKYTANICYIHKSTPMSEAEQEIIHRLKQAGKKIGSQPTTNLARG